ncbi:MAG: PspC domain-containing protein [Sphingomonadaceae bacterium]|nr:PspC domain-containing protein [Sphingomonadaceae bacterium]
MSTAQPARPSLIARHDTLLGVCEGLGEDLGINGNWFRIAFALALFLNPYATVAAYFVLGALVFSARLLIPVRRADADIVSLPSEKPVEQEALQLAA